MVTASLTTPAIVTVTALVTETRIYSVKTWNKILTSEQKLTCSFINNYKLLGNAYHAKSQCSTKKHQETSSSKMRSIIKVYVFSKFTPWIQKERKKSSHYSHNWWHATHKCEWIFQAWMNRKVQINTCIITFLRINNEYYIQENTKRRTHHTFLSTYRVIVRMHPKYWKTKSLNI